MKKITILFKVLSLQVAIYNKLLLVIVFLATSKVSVSQMSNPGGNASSRNNVARLFDLFQMYNIQEYIKLSERDGANKKKKLLGDYFLFDTWNNRCVLKTSRGEVMLKKVNYNVKTNEVLFESSQQDSKGSIYLVPPEAIENIAINNKEYAYHPLNGENRLFEVLYIGENNFSFLKGFKVLVRENPEIGKLVDRPNEKINLREEYFLLDGNGLMNPLKLKKKDLFSYIENMHHNKLKAFAKQNKLSFKREKDIVKILNYYNTL